MAQRLENLEDDFHLGYSRDLEEYHEEVDNDLENTGVNLLTGSFAALYPGHIGPRHPGHRSYIMYHGTTWANAQKIKAGGFIRSLDGMLGAGVYLSRDFRKASRYGKAVLKVCVRVGKVKKINYQGHPLQKTWHQHGYDTAWVPPNCGMVPSGLEEDCVYDPCRIKVLQIIPN